MRNVGFSPTTEAILGEQRTSEIALLESCCAPQIAAPLLFHCYILIIIIIYRRSN